MAGMQCLDQHFRVSCAGHPVQDHSGNPDLWIEALKAMHQRCNASGSRRCIHHQQHGKTEQFGNFSAAAGIVGPVHPIKKSHHALNYGYVSILACGSKETTIHIWRKHPGVEVVRWASTDPSVMTGIDEIRTAFERLNTQTAASQCGHHRGAHSSLAGAAGRSRNQKALHGCTSKEPLTSSGHPATMRTTLSEIFATR